jgi:hypothetical protein
MSKPPEQPKFTVARPLGRLSDDQREETRLWLLRRRKPR